MPELKPEITYDDFCKLDLRLATIKTVEEIPGADKLYKLTLDLGELGERVICAGIKEFIPNGQKLVGEQIVVVANLAPRKMRGVESHGMLLAASNADHSLLKLLVPSISVAANPDGTLTSIFLPAGSVVS